jgi:hypothetical protein
MKRWWPLVAAILYVVATFASVLGLPKAPDVNASGEVLVRYYRDHADALRTATWLLTWSLVPFVILMAHVRSFLSGLCRDVMLISVAMFLATGTVWTWFNAGLALHPGALDPHVARTLVDISVYFGPILTVADVLLAGAIGVAAWRGDGGLPRWLAYFSAAFALEQAIETITIFGKSGFIAPGGDMNFQLGAGLLFVWLIALGVATSRRAATAAPAPAPAPAQ